MIELISTIPFNDQPKTEFNRYCDYYKIALDDINREHHEKYFLIWKSIGMTI